MSRLVVQSLVFGLLLAVVPCVLPKVAQALDIHKTAEALASRAAKAFESGNMTEAATLYREAYHIDASQPAYLYGAARAAHTGRDLEHAEQDYVAFLALPDADPARVQKAKGYLDSLRAELSSQKALEAKKAESAGDTLLAATLYLEAWRMAPDRADPLLKAALLERQLGDKKAAIGHLQRYLQLAPADSAGRGTAETLLKQLGGALPGEKPAPPPIKPAVVDPLRKAAEPVVVLQKPKPAVTPVVPESSVVAQSGEGKSMSARRMGGWASIGVGGAAVIGAGILAILASNQQSTLNGNRLSDGHFDGSRITVATAASEQTSINGKWTGMGVAAGIGVAAIGVGAWLIASDRAEVAVVPSWDGIGVAGRF